MQGNATFELYTEMQYHVNKPGLSRKFAETLNDRSADHISSFILTILHQGLFNVSEFIISVLYLSKFKESSAISLHVCAWRPLFLTALLLADKMWEDKPVKNSSLAKLFPVLSATELLKLECHFLEKLKYDLLVGPSMFVSFCENMLQENVLPEISRRVHESDFARELPLSDTPSPALLSNSLACVGRPAPPARVLNGKPEDQSGQRSHSAGLVQSRPDNSRMGVHRLQHFSGRSSSHPAGTGSSGAKKCLGKASERNDPAHGCNAHAPIPSRGSTSGGPNRGIPAGANLSRPPSCGSANGVRSGGLAHVPGNANGSGAS